jgi:hypothetical protein
MLAGKFIRVINVSKAVTFMNVLECYRSVSRHLLQPGEGQLADRFRSDYRCFGNIVVCLSHAVCKNVSAAPSNFRIAVHVDTWNTIYSTLGHQSHSGYLYSWAGSDTAWVKWRYVFAKQAVNTLHKHNSSEKLTVTQLVNTLTPESSYRLLVSHHWPRPDPHEPSPYIKTLFP